MGDEAAPDAELEARRAKLARWRDQGVDPYGGRYEATHHASEVREGFDELADQVVSLAGRLLAIRRQGRAAFADLTDRSGRIQLFLRADVLGQDAWQAFAQCDLGDIIGVRGRVMRTRAGEVSVEVSAFTLLTKALRPLPAKWHGLKDTELRYRQRYLDLIANPEVRQTFVWRSRMLSYIRRFLDDRGFLEVETPVLHGVASGAAARPFITRHNALDIELHLRIALELHLKRLLVGGLERVYEIGRVFRNEGVSTRHNPEFTMLECYQAYADYEDMMRLTEDMVAGAALALHGSTTVRWQDREIELRPPWARRSMVRSLEELGLDLLGAGSDEEARRLARQAGVPVAADATFGQVVDASAEALVQPGLVQPTFLLDHPLEISPLARAKPDEQRLACRFEAIVGGVELANAFSELTDPDEQRRRFEQQAHERARGHAEALRGDQDFLRALEHGMPPAGGLGIGMDRLAMLLCDAASIRDVILFPHQRPVADR